MRSGQIPAPSGTVVPSLDFPSPQFDVKAVPERVLPNPSLTTKVLVRNSARGGASVLVTSFCARYKIVAWLRHDTVDLSVRYRLWISEAQKVNNVRLLHSD